MDRIGVAGVNWRRQGTDTVARYTVAADERADVLRGVAEHTGVEEIVYLVTCNRAEVIYVGDGTRPVGAYRPLIYEALTDDTPIPGQAERELTAWAGEGAVEHVFEVAAGLDSAMVGETEIRGQLRDAFELSRSLGLVGTRLEWLFEEAGRAARRVHGETPLGQGKISLAEIAISHVHERLAETPSPLGVVGVSAMTERCAEALSAEGVEIVVFNRGRGRAEELATRVGGTARALDRFGDGGDALEVVVCATGSPDPVLSRAALEGFALHAPSGRRPLIIDMANPADVAPADARAAGVRRVGFDDIVREAQGHRRDRDRAVADARGIVSEALDRVRAKLADRALSPLLVSIRRSYQDTADVALDRLFRKELRSLSADDRDAVRRWAHMLARRLAHVPLVGMRAVAREKGLDAAEVFLADADGFLRDELDTLLTGLAGDDRPRLPAGQGDAELEEDEAIVR